MYRNKEGVAKNADEIEKLKAMAKQLEDKTIEHDDKISGLGTDLENIGMNMSLMRREFDEKLDDRKLQTTYTSVIHYIVSNIPCLIVLNRQ